MGKILQADDMKVNQFVTVLSHDPVKIQELKDCSNGNDVPQTVAFLTQNNRSGMGSILRIEAIDLPYIVVTELSKDAIFLPRHIDIRKTKLMKISTAYRNQLLGISHSKKDSNNVAKDAKQNQSSWYSIKDGSS